jgi:hypothetical protein
MDTPSVKSYLYVLKSGAVAVQSEFACLNAAGELVAASAVAGLVVIGTFKESLTGDGATKTEVLFTRHVWASSDTTDVVTVLGSTAYLFDGHTVSSDTTATSVVGSVVAISATDGVLVRIAGL